MALLSDDAKRNVEAALVLAGTVAAVVLVPHGRLLPIALTVSGAAILALLGLRAYLRRLERAVAFLSAAGSADRAGGLVALLSEPERKVLGVGDVTDVPTTIGLLRTRQRAIVSFGTLVGMVAICAGLSALIAFEL